MGRYDQVSTPTRSKLPLVLGVGGVVAAIILVIIFISAGSTTITPGNVGIEVDKMGSNRGVQSAVARTGFFFYNPFTTEVFEYPIFMQTVKWTASGNEGHASDESITFTAKGGTVINADISMSYQLREGAAPTFYVKYRSDKIENFTDGYLRNVVRDSFNEIAGQYTVEELMGDNGPILIAIRKKVASIVYPDGINVEQLGFIGAPRPPQGITDSINLKIRAQQITIQKQNEVAQEQAEALKREAQADGIAKSNIILAEADAKANALKNQSLTPLLVEWKKIDKWDGHNPEVVSGSAGGLIVSTAGNK